MGRSATIILWRCVRVLPGGWFPLQHRPSLGAHSRPLVWFLYPWELCQASWGSFVLGGPQHREKISVDGRRLQIEFLRGLAARPMPERSMEPSTPISEPPTPIWIDDPLVDSQAMYSAFLHYQCTQRARVDDRNTLILDIVWHQGPLPAVWPLFTTQKSCQVRDCVRCRTLRGGYVFRWYAKEWADAYLSQASERAWKPDVSSSAGPSVE